MVYPYELIRSGRKTLSLEITADAALLVRAPLLLPRGDIDRFVESKSDWIKKHIEAKKIRAAQKEANAPTEEQIRALKAKALEILPRKTAHYAKIMGLSPVCVKITSAQKRLGSCSGKNGICYSYMLMLYPDKAIDYVVVHELAHIRHKNHGKEFYTLIARYMPDYRDRNALLKITPRLP